MQARSQSKKTDIVRPGYVLLVVLAVIVLVVTVLGLLAKVSLRRGIQSLDAETALQQRWGAYSLQRVLLNDAPTIFEKRDEKLLALGLEGPPPPPLIRSAVTFGGVTFDVMLSDEDAKLNLNAIYHHGGPSQLEQALSQSVPLAGQAALRLRPATEPLLVGRTRDSLPVIETPDGEEKKPVIPPAFRSWGEVFDLAVLSRTIGSEAALPNLTTDMTCWGSGHLNIRRASDNSILAVLGSVIQDGGAQRFLQRYRNNPATDFRAMMVTEISNNRQRDRLAELVAEASTNFSLWIDASTKTGRPVRNFIVLRRDEEGVTQMEKFAH